MKKFRIGILRLNDDLVTCITSDILVHKIHAIIVYVFVILCGHIWLDFSIFLSVIIRIISRLYFSYIVGVPQPESSDATHSSPESTPEAHSSPESTPETHSAASAVSEAEDTAKSTAEKSYPEGKTSGTDKVTGEAESEKNYGKAEGEVGANGEPEGETSAEPEVGKLEWIRCYNNNAHA